MTIESEQEEDQDAGYCEICNGSGEGMYDGSTCWLCKGSGHVNRIEDEDAGVIQHWERYDDY